MILAGVAGVVRWPVLAISTAIPTLVVVQGLHGLTFGATHLGAMGFIRERIDDRSTAGATSLYSGVATGLAFGIGLPLAGVLYDAVSGDAYFVMAAASAVGIVAAFALQTRSSSTPAHAQSPTASPCSKGEDSIAKRSRSTSES